MSGSVVKLSREDTVQYAEEIISDALRTGFINPALALECLYCAAEPDLIEALRLFSSLDPSSRAHLMAYGRKLAEAPQSSLHETYANH